MILRKYTPEYLGGGFGGGYGRQPGRFYEPWALAVDSHGSVHVVDTENDRVQRIDF